MKGIVGDLVLATTRWERNLAVAEVVA